MDQFRASFRRCQTSVEYEFFQIISDSHNDTDTKEAYLIKTQIIENADEYEVPSYLGKYIIVTAI